MKVTRQNFEEFVMANSVLFYAFAKRYINDTSIVQDIIQDCLVKLWENIDKLDYVTDAKLYVFTMIKHRALNIKKRGAIIETFGDNHIDIEDVNFFFNDILEAELNMMLSLIVDKLPGKENRLITLSLNGFTNKEISLIMDITEDAVKSLKKRTVKRLKDIATDSIFTIISIIIS